jgi:hypothetical protein
VKHSLKLARVGLGVAMWISVLAPLASWSQINSAKPAGLGAPSRSTVRPQPMYGAQPPHKIPQNKDGSRAVPDDPLAAFQADTALPPYMQNLAPFVGNFTIVTATPGNGVVMVREPDCSLTAFNVPYTNEASGPYNKADSKTTDYNQTLHNQSGIGTTGGNFGGHCPDPSIGINSSALTYMGTTTSGMRVGALAAYYASVGHNVLFTVIAKNDGTFVSTTQQPLPASNDPYAVASGDLNGDGNPDIVAVGYAVTSGTTPKPAMTVLLGNADGTFTVGQTYALPDLIADSVVIDDFNGDGKLDVVVPTTSQVSTNNSSGTLLFFPGNGDGTFGTPKTQALTPAAESFISGDFNGDGKKDLVSGTGTVFLGNGDGTFALQSTPVFSGIATNSADSALQLAAGDFNKDGKLDLAGGSGNSVYIYFGNGDGTFKQGPVYAGIDNQGYLTATDLDGDGNLDIFVGDAANGIFGGDEFISNEGYVMLGRGDGTFTGAPQIVTQQFNALEDLNGDGKLDFIGIANGNIPDTTKPIFTTFFGNGDGTFQQTGASLNATNFTYQSTQYTVNTIDSYGAVDLGGSKHYALIYIPGGYYMTNPTRIGFLTALSNPDGSFQTPSFTPVPSLVSGITGDYPSAIGALHAITNAAGKAEILYSYSTGYITGSTATYNLGYAIQVSNGDGTFATPALTIYATSPAPPSASLPPSPVAIVDLNNDKTPDLIIYVPTVFGNGGTVVTPPSLQVMLGNSDGTFGKPIPVTAVVNPTLSSSIAVGDVNGDGIPDLIAEGEKAVNGTNDFNITVALGKGDGTFQGQTPMQLANGEGFESFAVGDFTGDGKADIAILGFQPGLDSGLFPGNGDGTFQSSSGGQNGTVNPALPILVSTGIGLSGAYDFNGDGKIDLLGSGTFLLQTSSSGGGGGGTVATSTALAASATTIAAGQSLTLTATVSPTSGTGTPTGTVTFLDGTTSLGTGALNASGVATFSTTALAAGAHSLTASYGGDTNFATSTSTAVSVTVTSGSTGDFTISLSPTAATASAGASATLTVSITPSGGFNQAVNFACTGLPVSATCSFSPATVTPSGTAAVTTTLTIATTASSSLRGEPGIWQSASPEIAWGVVLFGLGGLLKGRKRWRHCLRSLQILCVATILFHLMACGGGSSQNTSPGTSTVTVTATSGSLSHSATVTLTVQ